jgi:TM2 domain-containing membrane protein YozV
MVSSAPVIRKPHPSLFPLTILGGMVATVLLAALIHLAPVLGLPLIDLPRLVGAVFSRDPGTALGVGYAIFVVAGMVVFPLLLSLLWPALPGHDATFGGALLKGLLAGLILWVLSGVLLPLFGALGRLPTDELQNPGFFALGAGLLGPVVLLAHQLLYGLTLALVAAMGRDVSPVDTIGWMWTSHGAGESP